MPQSQDQNLVVPRRGLQPDGSGREPIAHAKEHQPLCALGIPLPASCQSGCLIQKPPIGFVNLFVAVIVKFCRKRNFHKTLKYMDYLSWDK